MITESAVAPPAARIPIVDDERHNRQVLEAIVSRLLGQPNPSMARPS